MKIVQINATYKKGSTGKICNGISSVLTEKGIENYVICSQSSDSDPNVISVSTKTGIILNALLSRINGQFGFDSFFETNRVIKALKKLKPDIVHLHNIHSHFIHFSRLFSFLKKNNIKTIWTFHDCWAFTGYCMYFDMVGCEKWKTECKKCPQRKSYSWFFDLSNRLQQKKRSAIEGLQLTIVTPSVWLSKIVKQSFLSDYEIHVINNGIDLSVFKPTTSIAKKIKTDGAQYLLLGVSFDWDKRKGIDVFIRLAKDLGDEYRIILVGTNTEIEKRLPDNIISIRRTTNQTELVELYSSVDVFINPTREENFPTVNIESLACGTPVITYDTGGSAEIIDDYCGIAIEKDNYDLLKEAVINVCKKKPFYTEKCVERAMQYDMNNRFRDYLKIYTKEESGK